MRDKIKEEAQNRQKLEDEIMELRASKKGRGGCEAGLLSQASPTAGSGQYELACCVGAKWQRQVQDFSPGLEETLVPAVSTTQDVL